MQLRALLLLLLGVTAAATPAPPLDASASPRFTSFRFSCAGGTPAAALALRDTADDVSAFGWVQVTHTGQLVGEFRGAPATAPFFEAALRGGGARACDVAQNDDALATLHFADFKYLADDRETCFALPGPHACTAPGAAPGAAAALAPDGAASV